MKMRLRVMMPTDVLLDVEAVKVVAEAVNGSFCLLPRHIDFVAALVPGILRCTTLKGEELFVGTAEATLVKRGHDVLVSAPQAVRGEQLDELALTVQESFQQLDEDERATRSALARLEAGALRRLAELERQRHG